MEILYIWQEMLYHIIKSTKAKTQEGSMLLKSKPAVNNYYEVEEKIKRELVLNLKRQGIDISKIHIDFKTGNVNVCLSIKQ